VTLSYQVSSLETLCRLHVACLLQFLSEVQSQLPIMQWEIIALASAYASEAGPG